MALSLVQRRRYINGPTTTVSTADQHSQKHLLLQPGLPVTASSGLTHELPHGGNVGTAVLAPAKVRTTPASGTSCREK